MGDSYRDEIAKNKKRIQASHSAKDNREKAAKRAAIREFYARKSRARYPATNQQMRLF